MERLENGNILRFKCIPEYVSRQSSSILLCGTNEERGMGILEV